jgi:hypothetical protein
MNSLNNKSLLFITLILLFGFGVLYWLLKPVPNSWEKDSDRDGLVDQVDMEDSTRWIADTAMYPLSAYVDAFGKIDSIKTKPLCDCWNFQEITDRMVLKCQDNMNWFVFNWKLYQYRDGDFYLSEGVRMSASDDDAVEAYHRERFRTTQRQGNNGYWNGQTNNPLQQNPDALSTFTYKNQKYQIKQGFLSEDGMIFNGSRWRYYQNTWKKSDDNSPPYDNWMATNQADIDYLLSKIARKIQSGQTRTEQTRSGQTAQENPPAGADDQYWIDLVPRRNSLNGDNLCEAKSNLLIKTSLSREGKAAFKKVKQAINNKPCSF